MIKVITATLLFQLAIASTVFSTTQIKNQQQMDKLEDFDPTYVHTVYFWFKNPQNKADKQKFEASLKKFLAASKYAKTKFIGFPPKATRDVVDDSFNYSLVLTFSSAEEQAKYQKEPAHDVFVNECKDLWAKVIVYDSISIE